MPKPLPPWVLQEAQGTWQRFQRGRIVLLEQPWAAALAVPAPAPLSWASAYRVQPPPALLPGISLARDEPSQAGRALLTLVLQGGAFQEP